MSALGFFVVCRVIGKTCTPDKADRLLKATGAQNDSCIAFDGTIYPSGSHRNNDGRESGCIDSAQG